MWKTLSILLTSIIVTEGETPLIVILEVTSKSPVAEAFSPTPPSVSV